MKLSKSIPARTKTVQFNWCKKDWMEINQRYRAGRANMRDPMNSCYWCGYKFRDGEMLALAQPLKAPNKVLCGKCADELLASERKGKPDAD